MDVNHHKKHHLYAKIEITFIHREVSVLTPYVNAPTWLLTSFRRRVVLEAVEFIARVILSLPRKSALQQFFSLILGFVTSRSPGSEKFS